MSYNGEEEKLSYSPVFHIVTRIILNSINSFSLKYIFLKTLFTSGIEFYLDSSKYI